MIATPLRIGITCFPTFGGSGIIATEIGESLARRGHRVHFIAGEVPLRLDRFLDNVFFHEVEVRDYPLFHHSPYPLALASKMVEVASFQRLDLLHVHYAVPHATSAYLARQILAQTLGPAAPRVVTTLHGTDITLVGSDPSFLPITRFSILQSDGLTAPSEALRRSTYELFAVPPEVPIELIPNFVDSDRFHPAPARSFAPLRHLFEGRGQRPLADGARPRVLVHNSNFRPLKRIGDLIAAFAEVRRTHEALLILVGDGPERSRIEADVRERGLGAAVCFLGKQLNFLEVLQHADLFLLPSESESFGLAALEAMSCGVPVIASRTGGLPEVVDDGVTGLLHPVGDVPAIAAAIRLLLGDEPLHRRMSAAARQRVEGRFAREPMIDRYEACYQRVLSGKR